MSQLLNFSILLLLAVYAHSLSTPATSNGHQEPTPGNCEPDQNKLYVFGAYKLNWQTARHFCNSFGMHLASITSAREQNIIAKLITDLGTPVKSEFWTSGNDLAEKNKFEWASTGCRFSYTNWSTGEPNNVTPQHCVTINHFANYTWDNFDCYHERFFICEKYFN